MAQDTGAHEGDLILIEGHRLGESRRIGEILEVIGTAEHERYRVRWDDGHESIFSPGSDAVIRHVDHPNAEAGHASRILTSRRRATRDARSAELHVSGLGSDRVGSTFVARMPGAGRLTTVLDLLRPLSAARPRSDDWIYVHNFGNVDRPNAARLPAGRGAEFPGAMD